MTSHAHGALSAGQADNTDDNSLDDTLYDLSDEPRGRTERIPARAKKRPPREKADKTDHRRAEATRRHAAPEWFPCVHCGHAIVPEAFGTQHRNHCPWCLWSRHVDEEPGDRASECRGGMEPISVWARPGGDWAILHRCRACGVIHSNRIAGDDNEIALVALATRAIAQPPFPLSRLTTVEAREQAAIDAA